MRQRQMNFDEGLMQEYVNALPVGNVRCPACLGGRSGERSFRLWLDAASAMTVGKCFRASCGFFYRRPATRSAAIAMRDTPADRELLTPYTGALYPFTADEVAWQRKRYGIALAGAATDDGRYALPAHAPDGRVRGMALRIPHPGSPLRGARSYGGLPKLIYCKAVAGSVLAWYRAPNNLRRPWLVAVEDQISAQKVAEVARLDAVALIGTAMNQIKAREILTVAPRVILALDADAAALAFAHARRWGKGFERFAVLPLARDVKDDTSDDWRARLDVLATP